MSRCYLSQEEQQSRSLTPSHSSRMTEQRNHAESGGLCNVTHCDAGTQAPQVADESCVNSPSKAFKVHFQFFFIGHFMGHFIPNIPPWVRTVKTRTKWQNIAAIPPCQIILARKRAGFTKDLAVVMPFFQGYGRLSKGSWYFTIYPRIVKDKTSRVK